MGQVINLQSYKKCQRKKTINSWESRNYQFELFPNSLKNKNLSPGEIMFAQDQLEKIMYYLDNEKYRSNPNDLILEKLTDQYQKYLSVLQKESNIIPLF